MDSPACRRHIFSRTNIRSTQIYSYIHRSKKHALNEFEHKLRYTILTSIPHLQITIIELPMPVFNASPRTNTIDSRLSIELIKPINKAANISLSDKRLFDIRVRLSRACQASVWIKNKHCFKSVKYYSKCRRTKCD